jgi:aminoglycoside 3-N-acetyltransferase
VVEALLSRQCTVMVPTFSYSVFAVNPKPGQYLSRNGRGPGAPSSPRPGETRVYSPSTDELDYDMGAVPAAVLQNAARIRGDHPLCSFSAIGPLAEQLVSRQTGLDVFAPLRILAELDGSVVLMGVGL